MERGIESLVEEFLDYLKYERNYSVNTVNSYRISLQNFLGYVRRVISAEEGEVFGERLYDIRNIDADCVRDWIIYLMEEGYKSSSVHEMLSSVKSFFKFLRKKGIVDTNPLMLVKGPKEGKPLPYFVKDADMENLLDEEMPNSFESVRNRLIIEMFYDTGMRRAELIGLRDEDIDFALMQIKVTGKRNKQRLIPFADRLKDMMYAYLEFRNREIGRTEFFFVRLDGKQLYPQLVYIIVRNQLSEIPMLGKRSPHVLRHSFATSMLNNGAELNSVKEILGHDSLASTNVYTHTTFEELKKVYRAHPRVKKEGGFYGN